MAKKAKRKKVEDRITIRLEFEGQLKADFTDFRFDGRHENSKSAALFLIETGLAEWKSKRPLPSAVNANSNGSTENKDDNTH